MARAYDEITGQVDIEYFGHDWEEWRDEEDRPEIDDITDEDDEEGDSPLSSSIKKTEQPGFHTVEQGDTVFNLALRYGIADWKKIWEEPRNSDLAGSRDMGTLFPGDQIFIPDRDQPTTYKVTTGKVNKFIVKRPSVWLRLQLMEEDNTPSSEVEYKLQFEGYDKQISGSTESDGLIEEEIPAELTRGTLTLIDPDDPDHTGLAERIYTIHLGCLDPIESKSGFLGRLNNIGYQVGQITAIDEDVFEETIRRYQVSVGVKDSGQLDEETISALEMLHDKKTEPNSQ